MIESNPVGLNKFLKNKKMAYFIKKTLAALEAELQLFL